MKAVFVLCLLVVFGTFVANVAGKQILYIKHAFFRLLIIFEVNFFQKFFQQYMYYQSDKKFRSRPGSKHDLDLNCLERLSADDTNRHRGSYMSDHVLLNLLNELGKRDKMRGLPSILSLFRNEFNKFNNTRARMLDSIYHMTLRLLRDLISGVKTL